MEDLFQVIDEVKENAIDGFNFGVFDVKCFVDQVFWKFVFAVVSSTIHFFLDFLENWEIFTNMSDLVFFENFQVTGYRIPRNIQFPFNHFRTIVFKLLHFQEFPGRFP